MIIGILAVIGWALAVSALATWIEESFFNYNDVIAEIQVGEITKK